MNQINKILPDDIIDIIFYYKKQIDLNNIVNEIEEIKSVCPNCYKNKICMYDCSNCKERICYECRYADLNNGMVDDNDFTFFYKCDKCDMHINYHLNLCHSDDDYDSELDYYNEDRF